MIPNIASLNIQLHNTNMEIKKEMIDAISYLQLIIYVYHKYSINIINPTSTVLSKQGKSSKDEFDKL